jgi:hypothetical protein
MSFAAICIVVAAVGALGAVITAGYAVWKHQKNKHVCRGSETGRRFVPGIAETGGTWRGSVNPLILYGYTEVTYKCSECSAPFVNRYIGKILDPEHPLANDG